MQLSADNTARSAQLTTLKSHVNTNYVAVYDAATVNSMNAEASPVSVVWRDNVPVADIAAAIDGSEFADRTANDSAKAYRYMEMLNGAGFTPSRSDHIAFFDDIFSAAGGAKTRANLHGSDPVDEVVKGAGTWRRLATEAEDVLATGTGTNVSPKTLGDGAVGEITLANLIEAESNG